MIDDTTCIEQVERMTDHLERALPARERRRLELHVGSCPGCTEYVDQLRAVAGSLGGLGGASLPAGMRDGLVAAFRDVRCA